MFIYNILYGSEVSIKDAFYIWIINDSYIFINVMILGLTHQYNTNVVYKQQWYRK